MKNLFFCVLIFALVSCKKDKDNRVGYIQLKVAAENTISVTITDANGNVVIGERTKEGSFTSSRNDFKAGDKIFIQPYSQNDVKAKIEVLFSDKVFFTNNTVVGNTSPKMEQIIK